MHANGCHSGSWPSAFRHNLEAKDVNYVIQIIYIPRLQSASVACIRALLDDSLEWQLFHRTICSQVAHFAACPARTLISVHDCLLALEG